MYFHDHLDPTDYDGNTDSIITHVCELISLGFQPCSSVCECLPQAFVLQYYSKNTKQHVITIR